MRFLFSLFGCSKKGDNGGGPTRYVTEQAYKDNLTKQVSMTPQTVAQLRKHGVTEASMLRLEFFFTDMESKADSLAAALKAMGYQTEAGRSAGDDKLFLVNGWTTPLKMDDPSVVDWTRQMCKLGYEHDCECDGWGTNPEQSDEQSASGDQSAQGQTMLKLYLREDGRVTAYHEAWIDGSKVIELWGRLGERGRTREHPRNESLAGGEVLKRVLAEPLRQGYRPIDIAAHVVMLIEYKIAGMGNSEDLAKRHALEDRLNETLGWTGLGICDGGSIGSGTMEVCCYVVDFETAKRVVAKDLESTSFADYSRIYLEGGD